MVKTIGEDGLACIAQTAGDDPGLRLRWQMARHQGQIMGIPADKFPFRLGGEGLLVAVTAG